MTSSKTKDLRSLDKTFVDEVLTRQVAGVMLGGASVAECAKRLAISPTAVKTITAGEKYKELIAKEAEEELGPALAKAKAQLARLTAKAVKAIEDTLDTGSGRDKLQAATIVLKAVGLHEDEKQQQDSVINITLPAGIEPVTYSVEAEDAATD